MGILAQGTLKAQNDMEEGGRDIGLGLNKERQVSGPSHFYRKRMGTANSFLPRPRASLVGRKEKRRPAAELRVEDNSC